MSRTLFWYVLKDLLKVFLLTSGVLAGIMAFGGLLKPMMQYGLSGAQVARMLMYFMPATQIYSLPIAALFATTVVYGRLSADNELTACRACGISYFSMATPALIMGLVLALVSLAGVSWIVPRFTLKAEKVAFASLAEVVQKNIQRSHQLKLPGYVIYADSAEIPPKKPAGPDEEVVILRGPKFCVYDQDEETRINVPSQFFTARSATVIIRRVDEQVEFTALLEEGTVVPRDARDGESGGVGVAQFGPVPMPSPVRENTKFMDVKQLQELFNNPAKSREVRALYTSITRQEQERAFLARVLNDLRTSGRAVFANERENYALAVGRGFKLPKAPGKSKLVLGSASEPARSIRLERARGSSPPTVDEARGMELKAQSDLETGRLKMVFAMEDVLVGNDEVRAARQSVPRPFNMPTPEELRKFETRGPKFYRDKRGNKGDESRGRLERKLRQLSNGIESELHGRASFAVSCLILVMIGCALGMMFRTANYLSAFALSTIPALISIALIVTGQHVSENLASNSLKLGLGLIWGGNVVVLLLAATLLGRLQRQ